MTSNEHPDMSGNPMDAPFICEQCHRQIKEEDIVMVDGLDDLIFCSDECAQSYEDNRFGDERWSYGYDYD